MRHSKIYFRNHILERLISQEMFQEESYIIKSYSKEHSGRSHIYGVSVQSHIPERFILEICFIPE
jgi:hypothetical protein